SGVIPRYGGVIIHDCWASYLSYDQCGHGLCGSHLLRELTFIIDSNDYAWAANMKRLLQETCAIVAKSDAHNLWERLKKHEMAVLLFARLSYVPFTNNRAKRDLRMSKVKQKGSGCFRTRKHAEAYCRISSYLQTMANQGYNPLQACLRPRDRFWDIPVPKIDSAFDNLFVPQPSWSPSTTQQL
ncbi:IS66 family transposase, partial [Thiolapillus sp.]|uniref:IS66 family transposase n=1 Tax=Thiolapillus sp. TaxID=2017437 RepID=UPI003AF6937C